MHSKQTITSLFGRKTNEISFDTLSYSINLMWINSKADQAGRFVCAGQTNQGMQVTFNQLRKWSIANPDAIVNFWYDSSLTNPQAIQNMQDELMYLSLETGGEIKLRDIREIPFIQNNSDLFQSTLPVYFRIDYLKLIIGLYLMEDEGQDSVVYTDLSIGANVEKVLNKAELYSPKILANLRKWGMLTGRDTWKPENQFFQFLNTPELIDSLKHAINCCLYISVTALNYAHENQNADISDTMNKVSFTAMVFVYIYLLSKRSNDPILIRADIVNEGSSDTWVTYRPEEHQYALFGNLHKIADLGTYHVNFATNQITNLRDIVKLPAHLGLDPGTSYILELGGALKSDSFIEETVRNDLNPAKAGSNHSWSGPIPAPSKRTFEWSFWPIQNDGHTPGLASNKPN